MTGFIYDVLKDLDLASRDTSKLTLILPNKRAGIFLKNGVVFKLNKTTGFLPQIIAIETFYRGIITTQDFLVIPSLSSSFTSVYLELTPFK